VLAIKNVIASTSPDSQDICNPGAPGPPAVTARRSKTDVAVSTVIPQKPSIFLGATGFKEIPLLIDFLYIFEGYWSRNTPLWSWEMYKI